MTTIVVEDGTVLNGSPAPNSFVTEQEFRDFYTLRNDLEAAEADSEAVCASLVFAWDYMNQNYRLRLVGSLVNARQAGVFPRRGVPVVDFFDPFYRQTNVPWDFRDTYFLAQNEVPVEAKEAQMLLARASLTGTSTQQSLQQSLGRVTKREKLGDLEVEYFGSDGGGQRQTTLYWDAEKRLEPYLRPRNVGRVVRG